MNYKNLSFVRKTSIFIAFLLFFQTKTLYAGGRNPAGCLIQNCYYNGVRIAANISVTESRKLQILDVSTLNLKNNNLQKSVQQTNSAISVTLSDFNAFSAVGNSWLDFYTTNAMSMNIGTANNASPQTWTLPTNLMTHFSGAGRSDFIDPSSVPLALQRAGANRAMKTFGLDENDRLMNIYEHYDINSIGIFHLGTSYDLEVGVDDNFDELDYEYTDVPLDLGDVFVSIVEEKNYVTNLALIKYESDVTVDAFGTLATPDGTFNCLRMSILTKKYTRPNESSAYSLATTINQVSFMTKEGIYFNANVTATSGNATLSNVSYRKVIQTSQLTELSDVKINNNSKGVTINNDNDDPHPSAILDVKSSTLGVLIPRITMANRPATPTEGLLIYQIDNTPGFYYFDGTNWQRLSTNPSVSVSARVSSNTISENSSIRGQNQLQNGTIFIKFDQIQENPENLIINLQLEDDCNGLYISSKTKEGFWVKELKGGKSNARFSWNLN